MKEAWQKINSQLTECYKLKCKLQGITRALKAWNKNTFGFIHTQIKDLEDQLQIIQIDADNGRDCDAKELRVQTKLRE